VCELTAIFLSLCWLEDFKPENVVIFVDSLSALQAINTSIYKIKTQIIYDIYHLTTNLAKSGINIIFEWIPSHVGLQGNELADLEAKKALDYQFCNVYTPLYKQDIKSLCKTLLKNMWQENWDNNKKGRQLYTIQKTVSMGITIPNMRRVREVTLIKLRSGYINVNKFLFSIGRTDNKNCEECNTLDDLQHFFYNCKKYTADRNHMFQNLKQDGVNDYSLKNLFTGFSQTFVHVWKFLVDTGKLKG